MKEAIYKYELQPDVNGLAKVFVHKGSMALSVGVQDGKMMVWMRVDRDAEKEFRLFYVSPTGPDIPNAIPYKRGTINVARDGIFVGTIQNGPLVFHIFDLGIFDFGGA